MIFAQYQRLSTRIDSLQLRERAMLLVVSLVFLVYLADSIGFQPVFKKQQVLLQEIQDHEIEFKLLHVKSSQLYESSNDERLLPLARLQKELDGYRNKIQTRLDGMLSPNIAVNVLEQVISNNKGLILNTVNAKRTPLLSVEDENKGAEMLEELNSYEYELQLEGGYLETLSYLRALEALPYRFFWTGITFSITDYPKANVDLEIYTLAHSRN